MEFGYLLLVHFIFLYIINVQDIFMYIGPIIDYYIVHREYQFIINGQIYKMDIEARKDEKLTILRQAITAFNNETGIEIKIQKLDIQKGATEPIEVDAQICIEPYGKHLYVEVKRHAQHTNIGMLINQVKRLPEEHMLVADYINPNMANKLRKENIQYLDTAGNAFVKQQPLYAIITGKKKNTEYPIKKPQHANRAFEQKGLMVTYGFLTTPELLNQPYREIAATTNVAVGTVGWVVNALKAGRYIHVDPKTKKRRITNYQKLLNRWAEAWPEKLKPKLQIGKFFNDDPEFWEFITIEDYQGYLGGEAAAAWYTGNLRPEIITVYIPKKQHSKLMRDWQLEKTRDQNNNTGIEVHVYEPFWRADEFMRLHKTNPGIDPGFANPVLVYADLIATGDTRNIEIANQLYDERIARH